MSNPDPQHPNTLGKVSLLLGILGSFFVVCLGLCAGVGQQQGWLRRAEQLFFVLGGSAAFLGVLATVLGFGGLFGKHRPKATAISGLLLGVFTVWLFIALVQAAR